jgi:hypothetical protein
MLARSDGFVAMAASGMHRPQESVDEHRQALAEYDKAVALGRELLAMPLDRSAPANPILGDKRAWNVDFSDRAHTGSGARCAWSSR